MARSTFLYVTYIRTTPEKLWDALTNPEFIQQYWFGNRIESEFMPGSAWQNKYPDGRVTDTGEILEADRPRKLAIRWRNVDRPELNAEGDSICTMEIEPFAEAVRLTIRHTNERENSKLIDAVSGGWPKVISNLKSLLETGAIAMSDPYPGFRRQPPKGK